jgi:FkbM family methyltransferase
MLDYEQLLENFYRSFLKSGDVVIDAGAHTGRHTLQMIPAVSPLGEVHAFEPLPFARAELERATSVVGAKVVTLYPYALSDKEGIEDFVVALDLPAYSGLRTRIYDLPSRLERIRVEVRSLDSLFADARRLDYIKIDAEGGELGILRGAMTVISKLAPVVSFEFGANSIGSYGITVEDMAEFWRGKPYALYDILGRTLDAGQFIASANRQEVWDYVALPVERRQGILEAWRSCS